jgi:ATP-binding cassette, subfamily B, bacterial
MLKGAIAALRVAWQASPMVFLSGLITAILSGGLSPASAWVNRVVLDRLVASQRGSHVFSGVVAWAVLLAGLGLASAVAPEARQYLNGRLNRAMAFRAQNDLAAAVNRLPGLRYFESPRFVDNLRLAQDAGRTAPGRLVMSGSTTIQSAVTLAGFLAALMSIAPIFALLVGVSALPELVAEVALAKRGVQLQRRLSPASRLQLFYRTLQSDLRAVKEVRLFGLGDLLRRRMNEETRNINRAQQALDKRGFTIDVGFSALSAILAGGGFIWTVDQAVRGRITVGDVALFLMSILGVQASLGLIVSRIGDLWQCLGLFSHYRDVCAAVPDVTIPSAPRSVPVLNEGLRVKNVWFRYDDDSDWILRGIDLWIPRGSSAALIGSNGAGKSTLLKLLCRFYDPCDGAVYWDGIDIREFTPEEFREHLSAVFQDYMTYDMTAADNIGMGDKNRLRDRDAIIRASVDAGSHQAVSGLPNGYDTLLSRVFTDSARRSDDAPGVALSGGQWQRIALARALMRQSCDLILLDEPTSGFDTEAEHQVDAALKLFNRHRTSLLIAHRLSSVKQCDLINVLADGHIVESGSHEELMSKSGPYSRLFSLQGSDYKSDIGNTQPLEAAFSREAT